MTMMHMMKMMIKIRLHSIWWSTKSFNQVHYVDVALISHINRFGKHLIFIISVLSKFIGKKYKPTLANVLKNKRNVLGKIWQYFTIWKEELDNQALWGTGIKEASENWEERPSKAALPTSGPKGWRPLF